MINIEGARQQLAMIISVWVQQCPMEEYTAEAFRLSLISLEKQTPKQPTSKPWNGINGVPYKNCPNCGGLLWGSRLDREDKFCKECGQAIDWKGESPHE